MEEWSSSIEESSKNHHFLWKNHHFDIKLTSGTPGCRRASWRPPSRPLAVHHIISGPKSVAKQDPNQTQISRKSVPKQRRSVERRTSSRFCRSHRARFWISSSTLPRPAPGSFSLLKNHHFVSIKSSCFSRKTSFFSGKTHRDQPGWHAEQLEQQLR